MKKTLLFAFLIALLAPVNAQIPAFPGAEGGGMYVTGGRGGKIIYVTSLEDTGVGTLRSAISQSGTRTIVFKVSGIIALNSAIKINNGNVTIAGQTAPGDGICIKNYEVNINADNVIIRFMRFRLGDEKAGENNQPDAFWGRYKKGIMIDHCSMSWSIDECSSFYSNEDFTMQWCILSESLNKSFHEKDDHGYGAIWGGKNASFHHNLLAHHNSRNPRFNGWKRSGLGYANPQDEERVDFRNNVIYNFGDNSSYGGEGAGKYNLVANYFKYGPATKSSIRSKITQADIDADPSKCPPGYGSYFIEQNYVYGNSAVTATNWNGVTYATGVTKTLAQAFVPFEFTPITQHSAEMAFDKVLTHAGASLAKDAVDIRVTGETRNGTNTYNGSKTGKKGIIDSQTDVGGWPVYNSTTALVDTNNDGIPDGWLETNYPGKAATDTNEQGYTYFEVYINSLVQQIVTTQNEGGVGTSIDTQQLTDANQSITIQYHKTTHQLAILSDFNLDSVSLYTLAGTLVKIQKSDNVSLVVDLHDLPTAIYLVQIKTKQGTQVVSKIVRS